MSLNPTNRVVARDPADDADPLTNLLRASAALELDARARQALADAARHVTDWEPFAGCAEDHGLAPLARRHLATSAIALPDVVRAQLATLAIRHREAAKARVVALTDLADTFQRAGLTHLVLKGAALAPALYPEPGLRPMRDVDVLVAPGAGLDAARLLGQAGFTTAGSPTPWRHHHMPPVARDIDGHRVTVEVHEDALSYDQRERLTLDTMTGAPERIDSHGLRFFTFAPVDMLRHLSAHLLEPRADTRLIGVVDLVGYAARHAGHIDWDLVRRRYPRVTATIGMTDYLHPLPASLAFLRPRLDRRPTGVGRGLPLFGSVRLRGSTVSPSARALLFPSEWWMRAYYGVPDVGRLTMTRWSRHVPRVVAWTVRRYLARARERAARVTGGQAATGTVS